MRGGQRPGALWVDQKTLAFHCLASEESQPSRNTGQNGALAHSPNAPHRLFNLHFTRVDGLIFRDHPNGRSSTALSQERDELSRRMRCAWRDQMHELVVEPLKVREFVDDLASALWIRKQEEDTFLTRLLNEGSNRFPLVD